MIVTFIGIQTFNDLEKKEPLTWVKPRQQDIPRDMVNPP